MKQLIYEHFGLGINPWPQHQTTADARRIDLALSAALGGSAMVSIVGQRGIGKTHGVHQALADGATCTLIEPLRLDKENLHIGDIQRAIVTCLSDESPRHSGEARAGQVRRLLRDATAPLLLIDEAHCLHHQTLRSLKRLRELTLRGRNTRLLSIVLLGQYDPTARISEVALRTDTVPLGGLTKAEAGAALKSALGTAAEPAAITAIAGSEQARNWLDLQRLTDDCLAIAMAAGEKTLTAAHAQQVLGGPAPATGKVAAPAPGAVAEALGGERRRLAG